MGFRTQAFHAGTRLASPMFRGQHGQYPPPGPAPTQGSDHLAWLRWQGTGEPVVLLHGINSQAWLWSRLAPMLAPHDVWAPDSRGHGRSPMPESGWSVEHTTADLLAFLDAVGLDRVHLVGHSWGGRVAGSFAAAHPERVRSLVLADPVPVQGMLSLVQRLPWVVDLLFGPERGPHPNAQALEKAGRALVYLSQWDEVDQHFWAQIWKEQADGSYRHRTPERAFRGIVDEALFPDLSEAWQGMAAPTLLMLPTWTLALGLDPIGPLRRCVPRLREVKVAGEHTFVYTNPLDTAALLLPFLKDPR